MARCFDRKIVLEDGSVFPGYGFGDWQDKVCEIGFCTSMVGYQEIISDPSCADQMVVMTYPLIGNYGIADEDFESRVMSIGGLIVSEYNDQPSNFRYTKTLSEILEENRIPCIEGIDTRQLTRHIRDNGTCKVLITDIDTPMEFAMHTLRETEIPRDAVARVSCKKRWYSRTANHKFNVVAVDCGIKLNIIRMLKEKGCNVTVVPWDTKAEDILRMNPDGLVISNGPGNPEDVPEVIELIREIRGKLPVFGISLGHQVTALAYGAKTVKMKRGHAGGNLPVKNLITGRVEITAQNHGYAVDEASLEGTGLTVTHRNLLDGSVEGIASEADRIFCVQYNPESAPGPQDSIYLFDQFIAMMREAKQNA